MQPFHYSKNILFAEDCNLEDIAATHGTPCYVYSRSALIKSWQQFETALHAHPHQICYAVKANPSLAILRIFTELGAGFDVVSRGELERVLAAGGRADKVVFSGIGKSTAEISHALDCGIQCFNIESRAELHRIHQIAATRNVIAPIGLRINPDINPGTHPHITTGIGDNKFGIPIDEMPDILRALHQMPHVQLLGIGCHIGSQLTELAPIIEAARKILALIKDIKPSPTHINLGGGLGVCYRDEVVPSIQEYAAALCNELKGLPYTLILEPGRALVATAGILLSRIEYIKRTPYKNFIIIDAGMNDLIRPALYDAWHRITAVSPRYGVREELTDVVGPVCESTDVLGKNRRLAVRENDLLVIHDTGAYGTSMGSTYNSRPRPPEILVDHAAAQVIRTRDTWADLYRNESYSDIGILPNTIKCV